MIFLDIVTYLEGLDVNVVFAVVVGGTISVLLPMIWQKNRHKFENKVRVIDELQIVFRTQQQARRFIHNKINHKYFEFMKKDLTADNKPGVTVRPRQKALDISLIKEYEEFRTMDNSMTTSNQAYLILFSNKKITKLSEKRQNIFGELIVIYFELCHTDKTPSEAIEIMNDTKTKIAELKELEKNILWEYINSFSFWYKLKSVKHVS